MSRRTNQRRAKRRASGTRRAARSQASDLPRELLRAWREERVTTALDAELWVSAVLSLLDDPDEPWRDPDAPRLALSSELAKHDDPSAAALLATIAAVLPERTNFIARARADQLVDRGVQLAPWVSRLDDVELVEALAVTDELGDQDLIIATFRRPGEPDHVVSITADHNFDGLFRQVAVLPPEVAIKDMWAEVSDLPLAPITADDLAYRWARHVRAFRETLSPPIDDDARPLMPFIEGRQRALPWVDPDTLDGDDDEGDDDPLRNERRVNALLDELLASPIVKRLRIGKRVTEAVYIEVLDARALHAEGDLLRWSPMVVELCFTDWLLSGLPIKAEDRAKVLKLVAALVRFAADRKGVPEPLLQETLEAVDEFGSSWLRGSGPFAPRPAEVLVDAMLDDGVDLADPEAVKAWIDTFNGRTWEERDALIGRALDALPGVIPAARPKR